MDAKTIVAVVLVAFIIGGFTQVWAYIGELVFNMLVLVGAVKMSDRIIREMMGL